MGYKDLAPSVSKKGIQATPCHPLSTLAAGFIAGKWF